MKDSIKAKIEKLLSLAQSDNVNEANLAMEKAVDLMNRYSISEDQLNGNEILTKKIPLKYKVIPTWISDLYFGVASASGVFCAYANDRNGSNAYFYFSGKESDVMNAEYVAEFLARKIMSMSKKYTKSLPKYLDNMEKQFRSKSYRSGAVETVVDRMQEITKKFFDTQTYDSALVPVDTRIAEGREFFLKNRRVRKVSSKRSLGDLDAKRAGRSDANSISINKGVNGTSVNPIKQLVS